MKNLFLAVALALIGLTSCDFNTPQVDPIPQEITYYSQHHYSQLVFNDVVSKVLEYTKLKVNNPTGTADPSGVVISAIEDGVMTIEFVETISGNARLGKIKVTFTGDPLAVGSSMRIQPDGLTYSSMKVNGEVKIDILDKGTAKAKQAVAVIGGTITDIYTNVLSYSCNLTRTQNEGESNAVDTDDTFTYTGTANGSFGDKTSYSMTIDEPLVLPSGASYFKSGKVSMTPALYSEPFVITFGKGQYANQVLLTYKGQSKLYNI